MLTLGPEGCQKWFEYGFQDCGCPTNESGQLRHGSSWFKPLSGRGSPDRHRVGTSRMCTSKAAPKDDSSRSDRERSYTRNKNKKHEDERHSDRSTAEGRSPRSHTDVQSRASSTLKDAELENADMASNAAKKPTTTAVHSDTDSFRGTISGNNADLPPGPVMSPDVLPSERDCSSRTQQHRSGESDEYDSREPDRKADSEVHLSGEDSAHRKRRHRHRRGDGRRTYDDADDTTAVSSRSDRRRRPERSPSTKQYQTRRDQRDSSMKVRSPSREREHRHENRERRHQDRERRHRDREHRHRNREHRHRERSGDNTRDQSDEEDARDIRSAPRPQEYEADSDRKGSSRSRYERDRWQQGFQSKRRHCSQEHSHERHAERSSDRGYQKRRAGDSGQRGHRETGVPTSQERRASVSSHEPSEDRRRRSERTEDREARPSHFRSRSSSLRPATNSERRNAIDECPPTPGANPPLSGGLPPQSPGMEPATTDVDDKTLSESRSASPDVHFRPEEEPSDQACTTPIGIEEDIGAAEERSTDHDLVPEVPAREKAEDGKNSADDVPTTSPSTPT